MEIHTGFDHVRDGYILHVVLGTDDQYKGQKISAWDRRSVLGTEDQS